MRTLRILMIPAAVALFSGALAILPGCGGSADEEKFVADSPAITKSREAREAYAKAEKKSSTRRSSGRGTGSRG